MNGPERASGGFDACALLQDALRRVAYDDAQPDGTLSDHLAVCGRCRDELHAARELLPALDAALTPEPLPDKLADAIRARVAHRTPTQVLRWAFCAGGLAAAVLLFAIFTARRPEQPPPAAPVTPGPHTQAGSVGGFPWDGCADDALQGLAQRVAQAARSVEQTDAGLPWSAEDNWDWPEDGSVEPKRSARPDVPRLAELDSMRRPVITVPPAVTCEATAEQRVL
ncbi:MAG: hypothetical protein AB1716_05845 [Planctomycetota bacterium]